MNELEMIYKAIKDFFTRPILKIALYPLILTLVIAYAIFFIVADFSLDGLKEYTLQIQQEQIAVENGEVLGSMTTTQEFFGKDIINFLLQFSLTAWIISFLLYTVGTIFIMMFSLFVTVIVVGFFTPSILNIIKNRYYQNIEFKGYGGVFNSIGILIKSFFIMVCLFLLFVPLYFIPVLNIVVFNIPLYYFFYKLLNFDVTSTIMTKEEEAVIKYRNGGVFHFRTILLYLISMIPFIILFTTVFYIIYLSHGYFKELEKIRANKEYV